MKREDLYYVLKEQQKEFNERKEYVDRELIETALSFLHLRLPIIISGVRRCGKSTFLQIIKNKLNLNERQCLYVNFNDERLINFSIEDFQKIIDFLRENDYSEKCYLFLDEIQETSSWEKWIDRIKEKYSIFITGSNSKLLSKEISTVLTGRSINLALYPFSFKEYLYSKKINIKDWKHDLIIHSKIRKAFLEYLFGGGIPKVIIDNDKRLLKENYENILYRDIIKRFNNNLEKSIKEISLFLLSNISKELTIRYLSKITEIKNFITIKSILESFEKAFLFYFIHKFDYSIKKQIQNPRKIYCIDNGFASNVGIRFRDDYGNALENLVFLELKRKDGEIFYYTKKNECDFVIKEGTKIKSAIQVCYDLNEKNKEREINGLIEALEEFKLKEGIILTNDQEKKIKIEGKNIKIIPVWKWLMSAENI